MIEGLDRPLSLMINPSEGKLYWIDEGNHVLMYSDLDGNNTEWIMATNVEPRGMGISGKCSIFDYFYCVIFLLCNHFIV